ncbi:TPA: NAD(P)/FAD-dependent oxidoreductase [Burkholderia lata]
MQEPKRIVIVGGGIAGLLLATQLGRKLGRRGLASVTLLDKSPNHIWKPMLHTLAAGTRNIQQQQVVLLAHASEHGFAYQLGGMRGLDRAKREVHVDDLYSPSGELMIAAHSIPYDVLVLAMGSRANDFGTPGVREHCHFIDSLAQAETFNQALRTRVMRAIVQDEKLRVAIVGGGATGVELAAELSRLLEIGASYVDPTLRERLDLTLLEGGERILPAFTPAISESAEQQLRKIGFRVLTKTQITAAEADGFRQADGTLVPADLMVWAAGVKGGEFADGLDGLATTRSNQIIVRPTLQTQDDDSVFALGDTASLTLDGAQRPLPPTAQVATQQAQHLAKHLPAWLQQGRALQDFSFHDFGALVSISDYNAFGTLGNFGFFTGMSIKGRFAHMSHAMLYRRHQLALHGFRKATLLWLAERLNGCVQPKIRLNN